MRENSARSLLKVREENFLLQKQQVSVASRSAAADRLASQPVHRVLTQTLKPTLMFEVYGTLRLRSGQAKTACPFTKQVEHRVFPQPALSGGGTALREPGSRGPPPAWANWFPGKLPFDHFGLLTAEN